MSQTSILEGHKVTIHEDPHDELKPWFVRLHHPNGSYQTLCYCEDKDDALVVATSVATVYAAADVTWQFVEQDGKPTEIRVGNEVEFDSFHDVCGEAINRLHAFFRWVGKKS